MEGLGTHVIAEMFNCNECHLNDLQKVEEVMMAAAELSKATIVKPFFHQFSPYGISGVIVIAESHFTIHTWPEHGYAAVDIFTCGDFDYQIAVDYIKNSLESEKCTLFHLQRGILPGSKQVQELTMLREVENASIIG
ncbi:MAG: adenosylmethionine decarboxylase [Spirochaetes bacterium]|nr:adenosylmethionine decarboxylase [Spirochaetota bacterium]